MFRKTNFTGKRATEKDGGQIPHDVITRKKKKTKQFFIPDKD